MSAEFLKKIPGFGTDSSFRLLLFFVLSLGLGIRLINYFSNPGLWLDEALLALNLMERTYAGLLGPLGRNQVAPVLFLLIQKFIINLLGPGEMALRLFPLFCSALSLPLLYLLSRNLTGDKKIALTALFVFAFAPLQIRYSTEVKQYMTDVFVMLFLLWLYSHYLKHSKSTSTLAWLAISGILAVFLSNIAILVMFTIGLHWFGSEVAEKRLKVRSLSVMASWIIVFALYYHLFISGHQTKTFMVNYWGDNFMPFNLFSAEFLAFLNLLGRRVFFEFMFYNVAGFSPGLNTILITIFLVIYFSGLIWVIAKRKMQLLFFLLFPVILHLVLSGLKKYPFDTRLALYLSPLVIMAFSYGLIQFYRTSGKLLKTRWPGVTVITMILLIFPYKAYVNIPVKVDGIRESIAFINKNHRPGQPVCVYYYTEAPFKYYLQTKKPAFGKDVVIMDQLTDHWGNHPDMDQLLAECAPHRGRTWFLFSHLYKPFDTERKWLTEELKKYGTLEKSFRTTNSAAFLFDLTP